MSLGGGKIVNPLEEAEKSHGRGGEVTTVGSLSEGYHEPSIDDEEVRVCLTRKQWRDISGALLYLHHFHDDDGPDSRYNGEYEPILEEIDTQLAHEEDPWDVEEDR